MQLDFKPCDFLELLESERQWFVRLFEIEQRASQPAVPEESPEGQVVVMMLRDRARWLRN